MQNLPITQIIHYNQVRQVLSQKKKDHDIMNLYLLAFAMNWDYLYSRLIQPWVQLIWKTLANIFRKLLILICLLFYGHIKKKIERMPFW